MITLTAAASVMKIIATAYMNGELVADGKCPMCDGECGRSNRFHHRESCEFQMAARRIAVAKRKRSHERR